MPLISIVIPAHGRSLYTRDAVFSVLHQDFDDFDLTLSNNGGSPDVKRGVAEFMADPRFHYIEQPNLLNMPLHWEIASRAVAGDYLIILTNRCVLKQGVLSKIATCLRSANNIELVSWRWDDYIKSNGVLIPYSSPSSAPSSIRTCDELLTFARAPDLVYHSYIMPRGMNSCVSHSLIERIRRREGSAFQKIVPDLRFAFSCLLNANEIIHYDQAFFISQGLEVSNGAAVFRGDFRPYLDSVCCSEPWEDVPIKAPLVFNAIAQDFLEALRKYGRNDIRAEWNRSKYYTDCLMEIRIKRDAGILTASQIAELTKAVDLALQSEAESVRASVAAPIARRVLNKIKSLGRNVVRSAADRFRPHRHQTGDKMTFPTALDAAGFKHR